MLGEQWPALCAARCLYAHSTRVGKVPQADLPEGFPRELLANKWGMRVVTGEWMSSLPQTIPDGRKQGWKTSEIVTSGFDQN